MNLHWREANLQNSQIFEMLFETMRVQCTTSLRSKRPADEAHTAGVTDQLCRWWCIKET